MRTIYLGLFLSLAIVVTPALWAVDTRLPMVHLPSPVIKQLKRNGFSTKGVSIFIQQIGSNKPLLLISPDTSRNPASVIKLLTTVVALAELGPGYTWKTEVYVDGPIRQGQLSGNLYIKGYGDPYLTPAFFWRLLRNIRNSGINSIKGDLILDNSYFKPKYRNPSSFDGQGHRAYNVNPNALLVNFQVIRFRFLPDADGQLQIYAYPNPQTVKIENKIVTTNGRCRYWNRRLNMQVVKRNGKDNIRFSGSYPISCGSREMYRVVSSPVRFFEGMFRNLWHEQGGSLAGKVRVDVVPSNAELVYTSRSLPLSDIVRGINKYSNNVMTRHLLLTLGAEKYGSPGTDKKGKRVIVDWLRRYGLTYPEMVLDNGAGLSRKARITARHLGDLLLLAYKKPFMPEFISSLPISGIDGTMHHRFTDSEMAGRLHIKTGSLDHVRSMAGYLMDKKGRRYVVVMIHNRRHAHLKRGERVQNAVMEWLYDRE